MYKPSKLIMLDKLLFWYYTISFVGYNLILLDIKGGEPLVLKGL